MARGVLYEICGDIRDLFYVDESELCDWLGGSEFEELKPLEDPSYPILNLFYKLKSAGMTIGVEKIDNDIEIPFFVIDEEAKKNYFADRFGRFKTLVSEMTLDDFSSKNCWKIKSLIDDEHTDAVTTLDYGPFLTVDDFVRKAYPGKYYLGKAFLMD